MLSKTSFIYALALCSLGGDAQFSFTNTGLSTLSSLSINPTSTGSGYSFRTSDGQITVSSSRSSSSRSSSATGSGSGSLSSSDASGSSSNSSASSTSSSSGQSRRTTSQELTALVGTKATSASSVSTGASNNTMSSSSTSAAPLPSNTTPCNGYPELCSRQYSNITQICSHNSAFAIKNNAASNQEYGITTQLNDGIRMIQGETQLVNGTMYACHTSCDLLNAGTYESELAEVADWVKNHPYDVVTVLIGNSGWADGVTVTDYVDAIQNSGLAPYLYEPAYVPQYRSQWPTLSEMILSGKRVVMFIDYNANQTEVPYVLDEYSHFFSTPFSPTDRNFPCTLQLPSELSEQDARERYMYIANHNLNTAVSFAGYSLLLPNTASINETNGMYNQFGQLEAMVQNCTVEWDRPPNFLVVDYYNRGDPGPGSVFQVAAAANNVTYTRECCGSNSSSDAPAMKAWSTLLFAGAALAFWFNVL